MPRATKTAATETATSKPAGRTRPAKQPSAASANEQTTQPLTSPAKRKRPSKPAAAATAAAVAEAPKPVVTLAVDIGGTGIKTMLLDEAGQPMTDRNRMETPNPATPDAVLDVIVQLAGGCASFDRVSVGFPGVVFDGVVATAPNLDSGFAGFDLKSGLESRLGKPVRVANDADIQGYGAIEGRGVELVLTLGTGLGSALYVDGRLVPNLELAHHPFRKGKTYEENVGKFAFEKAGRKQWEQQVHKMISVLSRIVNYRMLYIGGGNAKKLKGELPANVRVVSNTAGLLGGIALWRESC